MDRGEAMIYETIIIACTALSVISAVAAFSCWRFAKWCADRTYQTADKFYNALESEVLNDR